MNTSPTTTPTPAKDIEYIIAIPKNSLALFGEWQGMKFDVSGITDLLSNFHVVPRNDATEKDESLKQVIHYGIVLQGERFLKYRRCKVHGTEKRLSDKWSLGIGGHLNDADVQSVDLANILATSERELHEELKITGPYAHRAIALLNDDSDSAGRCHIGIVHVFDLFTGTEVESNEKGITELQWLDYGILRRHQEKFESWSQILIDQLGEILWRARK